jgi:hypothetical protein
MFIHCTYIVRTIACIHIHCTYIVYTLHILYIHGTYIVHTVALCTYIVHTMYVRSYCDITVIILRNAGPQMDCWRAKPRLGGLTVEETAERQIAKAVDRMKRAAETRQRRKALHAWLKMKCFWYMLVTVSTSTSLVCTLYIPSTDHEYWATSEHCIFLNWTDRYAVMCHGRYSVTFHDWVTASYLEKIVLVLSSTYLYILAL